MFDLIVEHKGILILYCLFLKVLVPAANMLQLQEVTEACCDFLQSQLSPTNCIGINAFADLHSCTNLTTISEVYIHQHFSYEI